MTSNKSPREAPPSKRSDQGNAPEIYVRFVSCFFFSNLLYQGYLHTQFGSCYLRHLINVSGKPLLLSGLTKARPPKFMLDLLFFKSAIPILHTQFGLCYLRHLNEVPKGVIFGVLGPKSPRVGPADKRKWNLLNRY